VPVGIPVRWDCLPEHLMRWHDRRPRAVVGCRSIMTNGGKAVGKRRPRRVNDLIRAHDPVLAAGTALAFRNRSASPSRRRCWRGRTR